MKNKILFALLTCMLVLSITLSGCGSDELPDGYFLIEGPGEFSHDECVSRGLENQIIMLGSQYCGHCKDAEPVFLEACEKAGVTPLILDVSKPIEKAKLDDFKLKVKYTPTFLLGCKYYVGGQYTVDEYSQFIADAKITQVIN